MSLDRREFITIIAASPLVNFLKETPKLSKFEEGVRTDGISILGKFWRQKRWEIFGRFFEVVRRAMPNLDIDTLRQVIINRMTKEGNNIHYIYVAPGHSRYYVHFKYIRSDMALAEPLNEL